MAKESKSKPKKVAPDRIVKKMGRPTKFCKEMADMICRKVATTTDGLRKICARLPELPHPDTIREWRLDYPEFSAQYAEAKRIQADLLAEEILDISDDDSRDEIIDDSGNTKVNSEYVQRSRLRVDSRKWIAAKLMPKVYGEKIQNEVITRTQEDVLKELTLLNEPK
jgi:hypothetical protein